MNTLLSKTQPSSLPFCWLKNRPVLGFFITTIWCLENLWYICSSLGPALDLRSRFLRMVIIYGSSSNFGGGFLHFFLVLNVCPARRQRLKTSGSSVKLCITFSIWFDASWFKTFPPATKVHRSASSLQVSEHIPSYPHTPCLPFVWLISYLLFSVVFI